MPLAKVCGIVVHDSIEADRVIDVYDEAFFDSIDGVTNALDNVEARKHSNHLP